MNNINRHLIALFGATASGKTSIAVEIAKHYPIEVISADSRQIRKKMSIGTAAPTIDEMSAVKHHLIAIVEPNDPWTIEEWLRRATIAADDIFNRNHIPLLLAGTGQYAWTFLKGLQIPLVPPNKEFRLDLEEIAKLEGANVLHKKLSEIDKASADRIDYRNTRRVIRALEINHFTGNPVQPITMAPPNFSWDILGLHWDRSNLYSRSDRRVEFMYEIGLIEETKKLIEEYGTEFEALKSIGYSQTKDYIEGLISKAEAIELTQLDTHRLIRMQDTWFRKDDAAIKWIEADNLKSILSAIEHIVEKHVR
ncbi:MAG: tRNA (adenosine(37)-N6)-dimethylallyltransferase MiaA [Chloroflexi bacterium]|nr:tRNA (adenosine(37)-N6)-dimethylallyltransferase MiaA [Chloroflexota bacterium]|tara:strand:+ start:1964 stop:2890 length:927 start_codon:yes stop_codon:yes gene_type:complete